MAYWSDSTRVSRKNWKPGGFHYKHGIPGIPTDGNVVLLKNSNNGSQLYLVGTVHCSEDSIETVKKVIDHVRPDSVAIEMGIQKAKEYLECVFEDDDLYTIYLRSRVVPGELPTKVGNYIRNCQRLLQRDVKSSSLHADMVVAMEESSRVGAHCFFIDKDNDAKEKLEISSSLEVLDGYMQKNNYLGISYLKKLFERREYTRAHWREYFSIYKDFFPEFHKLFMEDRDKIMFTRLREMEGKLIVAVVGRTHMDGIELLWKRAEDQLYGTREETLPRSRPKIEEDAEETEECVF